MMIIKIYEDIDFKYGEQKEVQEEVQEEVRKLVKVENTPQIGKKLTE